MSFHKHLLPPPIAYFEDHGLKITGSRKNPWFTTECRFHGGSDSMRVNQESGGWICMSCGVKGGDIISYEMQLTGDQFVDVVKRLGAWVDDGRSQKFDNPSNLPPRLALQALGIESNLIYVAAANLAQGRSLTESDRSRLLKASKRILFIAEAFK